MRLLIAEDERDLAEALSVFFEKNQFTVDTVCNGFDAYEYAVTGDYDAIREYHRGMGCVCYENLDMGLYFINDPDDYWIEILPLK